MKNKFIIFLTSLALLFLIFSSIQAQEVEEPPCDESNEGTTGFVPCNIYSRNEGTFVPACRCQVYHVFILLNNIFRFTVRNIATPLAILMLTIGGVMILISAGNPNLASLGKNILRWAIIGLVLVFCSWVIINFILTALGYQNIGSWNIL